MPPTANSSELTYERVLDHRLEDELVAVLDTIRRHQLRVIE
jgi:hypothetical protein